MPLPDFDTLQAMATRGEGELEALLRDELDAILRSASPDLQRKLTGLQFKIDCQKRLARNPVDCCVRLSTMLRRCCRQMRWVLEDFQAQQAGKALPSCGQRDTPGEVVRLVHPGGETKADE